MGNTILGVKGINNFKRYLFCFLSSDKTFSGSELTARLEPAFLAGLRSVNPAIRIKFMDIFSKSVKKRIYDRLMYVISTQNWEHMGNYYWIKQCLELLLNIVQADRKMMCSSMYSRLPSCVSVLRQQSTTKTGSQEFLEEWKAEKDAEKVMKEQKDAAILLLDSGIKIKTEPVDDVTEIEKDTKEEVFLPKYFTLATESKELLDKINAGITINADPEDDLDGLLTQLADTQGNFLKQLNQCTMGTFVHAVAQLSHRSTILAHKIWVDMFPNIWELLEERHHMTLSGELGPFLCSGSHLAQTEGYRSSINTLVEGMAHCDPPIPIRPIVLKYLGKTHNLWHQAALTLENMAVACDDMMSVNPQLPLQQPWLDFGKRIFQLLTTRLVTSKQSY